MSIPETLKSALLAKMVSNPAAYAMVYGMGIGSSPLSEFPVTMTVFVPPAPDCVLQALATQIKTDIGSDAFVMLQTTPFYALAAAGMSIGPSIPLRYNVAPVCAGTLGAAVDAGSRHFLIGSNHVLAFNGRAPIGTAIGTPGTLDDPSGGAVIARLAQFVDLRPAPWRKWSQPPANFDNAADCALAELTPAGVATIGQTQPVQDYAGAYPAAVHKTGRTTGLTKSLVCFPSVDTHIEMSFGTYYFRGLLGAYGIGPGTLRQDVFAANGDSGSLVLSDQGNQAIGLVMARAWCSGAFSLRPIPMGLFAGYIVVLCPMAAVRGELAKVVPGVGPNQFVFKV